MAKERTLLEQIEHDVLTSQPLADTLRKCVVLGGKAGPIELRDWATRELRGYDSKGDAPDYRTVGALVVHRFRVGAMLDSRCRCLLVSSFELAGPAALQTAIQENFGDIFGAFENCLEPGPGLMKFNKASESGFAVIGQIADRSFLLIDDTFTTGARLQSAHHALVSAGAKVPVSMVVTRKINPSQTYGTEALWERQQHIPFRFDDSPWWKIQT